MVWRVPKIWEGGECWIIGGGPSIPYEFGVPEDVIAAVQNGELAINAYSQYLVPIHGRHVIGVNAAFLLGTWLDFLFFGDHRFFTNNMQALMQYPKPRVSCHPRFSDANYANAIKFVPRDGQHRWGISPRPNHVSWNSNSGGSAIGLAYHLGAQRIYLLGFDMDLGPHQNQHWHRHYMPPGQVKNPKGVPFHRHLRTFAQIAKDARRLGISIYNISQNSKIEELPKRKLSEVL